MFLQIFLAYLFNQNALSEATTTYNYTIGLLYEELSVKNLVEHSARVASSDHIQIKTEGLYVQPSDAYECLNAACYILGHPTMAILGPTSKVNVDSIQSLASAREIPHILTDYVGPLTGKTQLSFHPSIELMTKAYIDVLSTMNWKMFTILHTSEHRITWGNFIEEAQKAGFIFDIKLLNPHHFTSMAEDLKKSGRKNFLINCLDEEILDLLYLFQNFGMITTGYSYFFTSVDYNTDIPSFKYSGADIIKMHLQSSKGLTPETSWELSSMKKALYFDAIQMFANSLKALKPVQNVSVDCKNGTAWRSGTQLINHLLESSHKGVTGEIRFGPDRYRSVFKLSIEQLKPGGLKEIGTWDSLNGITYTKTLEDEETKYYDWRKTPLKVVTKLREPYLKEKESPRTLYGNDRYVGFVIDVMDAISEIENFTYVIMLNHEGIGWYNSLKQSWTGMIGDIQTKKADLAVTDMTITLARSNVVEFTPPFIYTGITILFQKAHIMPPSFFHFARPFSKDFWIATVIAFVAVTISLFITGRLCKSEWQRQNPSSIYVINQLTFLNSIWFVAGSLFRQNTQVKIRSIPGRIIAAAWWLFCFLVIAMYIAALVAHRVEYEKSVLFTDVQSLVSNAREHGIEYGALKYGTTMDFFRNSNDPLYQEIYQHMVDNPESMVESIDEAVKMAESSRYAFFGEETTVDYIRGRYCDLEKYGGNINENAYGVAMAPYSPYFTPISTAILKLNGRGKLEELKHKWWRKGSSCYEVEESEVVYPVNLTQIFGLIQITLVGVTLAVISATIEFLIYTLESSRKQKIGFCQAFIHEIKRSFSKNKKKVKNSDLITRPILEQSTTSEAMELS